jgi:hypothetical protein
MKPQPDVANLKQFEAIRGRRARKHADRTLGFMADQFKREVARPYKQLGDLTRLWAEMLPESILNRTRLEALSRGVLTVACDSSAALYELDRLLREGLEAQLIQQHTGPAFRRIKLRVAELNESDRKA